LGSPVTQFVNDASRANLEVGHDLKSSTKQVQAGPIFQLDGRNVQLFDTPGFDDTTLTDTQILKGIAVFLEGM
jgi:GTP1/Obg family GTP-binding protein